MSMSEQVVRRGRVSELTADLRPPTDDDVPLALDATRLDTVDKLIAHLDRVNAERDRAQRRAG
jgi:hypothetical protein